MPASSNSPSSRATKTGKSNTGLFGEIVTIGRWDSVAIVASSWKEQAAEPARSSLLPAQPAGQRGGTEDENLAPSPRRAQDPSARIARPALLGRFPPDPPLVHFRQGRVLQAIEQ